MIADEAILICCFENMVSSNEEKEVGENQQRKMARLSDRIYE